MTDQPKIKIANICRTMIRPIVRLLLRHGMTFQDFSAVAKSVFVDVAGTDFGIRNRPANASRVAILTGLSRRDVSRIREQLGNETPVEARAVDRASRVLAGWHDDPEFQDAGGLPASLVETGSGPSFQTLFSRYGGDVPMSAMLKELLRSKAVKLETDGRYYVCHRYYMPEQTDGLALERSATVIRDLGSTVYYNLARGDNDPSYFEGRATNKAVPVNDLQEFRLYMENRSEEFLDETDRWLSAHESDDPDQETVRLGVGLYLIKDPR